MSPNRMLVAQRLGNTQVGSTGSIDPLALHSQQTDAAEQLAKARGALAPKLARATVFYLAGRVGI